MQAKNCILVIVHKLGPHREKKEKKITQAEFIGLRMPQRFHKCLEHTYPLYIIVFAVIKVEIFLIYNSSDCLIVDGHRSEVYG